MTRPTRDAIVLTGLRVRGRHGVYDFERERGQDFVIDVRLELDLAAAARSDEVTDTVHYGELAERLVTIVAGDPVNLIETLAERLADACLVDERVAAATITVHKPQAPIPHDVADVAVMVTRARRPPPIEPPAGAVSIAQAGPEAGAGPIAQAGPEAGVASTAQAGPDADAGSLGGAEDGRG